jgi:hypothetical protein
MCHGVLWYYCSLVQPQLHVSGDFEGCGLPPSRNSQFQGGIFDIQALGGPNHTDLSDPTQEFLRSTRKDGSKPSLAFMSPFFTIIISWAPQLY